MQFECLETSRCPIALKDLLPDVGDFCGSHFFVLCLNHGKAAHSVQQAAGAQQVDRAPLLGKLCERLPPEERQHQEKVNHKTKWTFNAPRCDLNTV